MVVLIARLCVFPPDSADVGIGPGLVVAAICPSLLVYFPFGTVLRLRVLGGGRRWDQFVAEQRRDRGAGRVVPGSEFPQTADHVRQ
ncbi:hypothetical protein ACHMW5_36115 (plasmid) [Azospirillum melinis]|uniref:hypothetical protein n=1 Tax=Azospirillum melinis TaxID=328839 RepID=UPI00375705AD